MVATVLSIVVSPIGGTTMKKRDLIFAGIFIFFCFGVLLGMQSTQLDKNTAEKELANCQRARSLCQSEVKQQTTSLEEQLAQCNEKLAAMEAAPTQAENVIDAAEAPAGEERAPGEEAPGGQPAGGPATAS
jgi:hypothetical protein